MKNCDCEISQLVIKLFTKLSWLLDTDCKSQGCSREYLPRRSGSKKKKKYGGAGSRHRRNARRAGTAGTARCISPSSSVPDRATQPARAPSVPDQPNLTASMAPPPPSPPPLPPRSTSLIQDVCGVIMEPPPQLSREEKKKELMYKLMETSNEEEKSKLFAKLRPIVNVELISKITAEQRSETHEKLKSGEKKLLSDKKMKNLPNLRSKTVTQGQHTLDISQTTLESKDQMIKHATRFLDQAIEQKSRDAENKMKWEKVKTTPGMGFQKNQTIPNNVPFCLLCKAYKSKIHYCTGVNKYLNLDDRNLVLIEGVNADEVEGRFSNTGKCTMFGTKREMRTYLWDRAIKEKEKKEEEKIAWVDSKYTHNWTTINRNGVPLEFLTPKIKVDKDDLEEMGPEAAITLARERPARLAKAQLERKELEKAKEQANILECTTSKAELGETYLELKGVPPHLAN